VQGDFVCGDEGDALGGSEDEEQRKDRRIRSCFFEMRARPIGNDQSLRNGADDGRGDISSRELFSSGFRRAVTSD